MGLGITLLVDGNMGDYVDESVEIFYSFIIK